MAQEWRTVLVDKSSGLPVYDIEAAENEHDKPRSKVHYTYPADMKIEPPIRRAFSLCLLIAFLGPPAPE